MSCNALHASASVHSRTRGQRSPSSCITCKCTLRRQTEWRTALSVLAQQQSVHPFLRSQAAAARLCMSHRLLLQFCVCQQHPQVQSLVPWCPRLQHVVSAHTDWRCAACFGTCRCRVLWNICTRGLLCRRVWGLDSMWCKKHCFWVWAGSVWMVLAG